MKIQRGLILILSITFVINFACSREDSVEISETIYVRHKGADMPAYIHGNYSEKVFLIVLHGAGSYGLAFRDGAFTSKLEKEFVVVYGDQRGQGMSQGHYEEPDDLIGLMIEDVDALVQILKEKYGDEITLFLMGHSWGGMLGTAMLLNEDNQALFNGWISVDGAHDFPYASRARRALMLDIAEEQIAAGNLDAEWEALKAEIVLLDSLSVEDRRETLMLAQRTMKLLLESEIVPTSLSSEKMYRAIIDNNPLTWQVSNFFNQPVKTALDREYSLSDSLNRLEIPVLLMYGKYDVSVPPVLGEDAYRRVQSIDKKLVIFEHSMHHPHDTEPEKFAEELLNFIQAHK